MKAIDYAKAAGLAVLVLAANLLVTTVVIFGYSQAVEPGQPPAYYAALAPKIAAWSAPAGGAILMFLVGYVFGRRRPERNALAFVLAVFALYVLVDLALGLAAASPAELLTPQLFASLAVTGVGGLIGASIATRRRAA